MGYLAQERHHVSLGSGRTSMSKWIQLVFWVVVTETLHSFPHIEIQFLYRSWHLIVVLGRTMLNIIRMILNFNQILLDPNISVGLLNDSLWLASSCPLLGIWSCVCVLFQVDGRHLLLPSTVVVVALRTIMLGYIWSLGRHWGSGHKSIRARYMMGVVVLRRVLLLHSSHVFLIANFLLVMLLMLI
jgi:hypothetical protein